MQVLFAMGHRSDVMDIENVGLQDAKALLAGLEGAHDAVIGIVEHGTERQRLHIALFLRPDTFVRHHDPANLVLTT